MIQTTSDQATSDQDQKLHMQKLQALGELAGGVAHDFNNILSIIEGYARMLERQLGWEHPAYEKLEPILAATRRGASLTRRLLAFGRQQILPQGQCDLAQVVQENEVLLRPLLTYRVGLHLLLPQEPVFIGCDADTISQILINLAVNARDAIKEQGAVWIAVAAHDNDVKLVFSDNGSGMLPEIQARIFEPFYTTKPQGQGTGLGLSMIAGLMQQLNGQIEVNSRPNEGTQFVLTFPRVAAQAVTEAPSLITPADLRNKTVLIVDDEEALLPVLEAQLKELGMKVLKAANADKALMLQEDYDGKIDLLLTDVVMPGLNGVRLAELATSLRPEMGVVYMTGYPNRGAAAQQGASLPPQALVLPKPLPLDELSPTLQKALARVSAMPRTH